MRSRLLTPVLLRRAAPVAALSGAAHLGHFLPSLSRPKERGLRIPPSLSAHCSPKQQWLTCNSCGESLQRDSFGTDQLRLSNRTCTACARAAALASQVQVGYLTCIQCHEQLSLENFSHRQRRCSTKTCRACFTFNVDTQTESACARAASLASQVQVVYLTCIQCHEQLPLEDFSQRQRRRSTKTCRACCTSNIDTQTESATAAALTCSKCLEELSPNLFSVRQRNRCQRICNTCCSPGAPAVGTSRISLGDLSM